MRDLELQIERWQDEYQEYRAFLLDNKAETGDDLKKRMDDVAEIKTRTGEIWADLKAEVNRIRKAEVMEQVVDKLADGMKLSATTQKSIIDGLCEKEQKLLDRYERLNRDCTMFFNAAQSKLSYEKEMARLNKTGY